MPFTFAHPAIVLPFRKANRFSFTAVVAGSMVPDFEFFFQMREVENIGHHWYGIFIFDLPMALLFCFLFHNLMRETLLANLPNYFRKRFAEESNFNWNAFAVKNKWTIVFSLLTGIGSHILWDGFTHFDGIFVELIPALSSNAGSFLFNMPVYFLLQVGCSVVGLAIIILSIHGLPESETNAAPAGRNKWYWPSFLLIVSVILFIRLAGWPQYNSFWGVFMALMGAGSYAWLMVSFLIKQYTIHNHSL